MSAPPPVCRQSLEKGEWEPLPFTAAHFQNAAAGRQHQFSCSLDRGRIHPILAVHLRHPVFGDGIEHGMDVAQDHFQHPFTRGRSDGIRFRFG
jgi:hypothetical protein